MAYLVFRRYGIPVLTINGGVLSEAGDHIRNGYTQHSNDFDAGVIVAAVENSLPTVPDHIMTFLKNLIVHFDGSIEYHPLSGILYWSGPLRFIFNTTDGKACSNYAEIGAVQLGDNEFAYVDLSETNGAEITVEKAAVSAGSASNFIAFNRVVLGYRNVVSNDFFPVALRSPWPNTVGS